jgi:hypothetical protein
MRGRQRENECSSQVAYVDLLSPKTNLGNLCALVLPVSGKEATCASRSLIIILRRIRLFE